MQGLQHTGYDKNRLIVVCTENKTIINNNTKVNSTFHILATVSLLLPHPIDKRKIHNCNIRPGQEVKVYYCKVLSLLMK